MAFSIITADPTWGTPVTNSPITESVAPPTVTPTFDGNNSITADLGAVVNLAAINTSGITKPTAGWITYNSSGGGGVAVRDTYIDSSSDADTAWTGTVPSHIVGDLLIAVVMTRNSGGALTPPTGWTQQGSAYLSNLQFNTDAQTLKVFTKVATASESATAVWTQATSARICGFLVSMVGNNFNMGTAATAYGNAENASITNTGADFYITAATWIYSATSEEEAYSQTGPGLTQITDSPIVSARISGGYTSESGLVESFHDATSVVDNPNHGIISIPFSASGGGGGSTRPTSGFLYPRGQG